MSDSQAKGVNIILQFALLFILPFAIMDLWGWYVAPFGMPNLSYVQAMGIQIVISFFGAGSLHFMVSDKCTPQEMLSAKGRYCSSLIEAYIIGWILSYWL